jgi:hypothetical protein
LSILEVTIVNPLQGNPVFVDIMDLLLRGSFQCVLTRAIMLVSGGAPSLHMLGRVRDGRPSIGPMGKITGVMSSQISKLGVQLLRFGVLCFPAMDKYIASKLSKMLNFCFNIGFITSRLCLKGFLLIVLV